MAIHQDESVERALHSPGRADAGTVLVVDDDPAVLRMLRSLFEETGCRVIEAGNGREALSAHENCDNIDLIVSDLEMPVMDGFEMCRWLRGSDAQVIIISGMDLDPGEVCASPGPIVGFFAKPLDVGELLATAVELIEQ